MDKRYKQTAISRDADAELQKLALKWGMDKKTFVESAVKYFKETKKDPRDWHKKSMKVKPSQDVVEIMQELQKLKEDLKGGVMDKYYLYYLVFQYLPDRIEIVKGWELSNEHYTLNLISYFEATISYLTRFLAQQWTEEDKKYLYSFYANRQRNYIKWLEEISIK